MRAWRARVFAWIPAYAGTTSYLGPATFKAPDFFAMMRYPTLRRSCGGRSPGLCAHGAPRLRLDPGLRRDDNVYVQCKSENDK